LVALLGAAWASATVAVGSTDPATIAFSSDRDGNNEIYVMSETGRALHRLTKSPKFDGFPRWSPDGRRILFYSQRSANGDVWVMSGDATAPRSFPRSAAHDGAGAWSSDGKRIVFVSTRAGSDDVYVMRSTGAGVTRLTNGPTKNWHPSWSPD